MEKEAEKEGGGVRSRRRRSKNTRSIAGREGGRGESE